MTNFGALNLTALYDGLDDPRIEADLEHAEAMAKTFAEKWQGRTDYLQDAKVLREALDEFELLYRNVGTGSRPAYFLRLSHAIDEADDEVKARKKMVEQRTIQMENQLSFFELSLGQIESKEQGPLLASALLAPYRAWLERRFKEAAHDLPVDTANAINLILPQAVDAWASMIDKLLAETSEEVFTGSGVKKEPFNSLPSMLTSPDSRVVDSVGKAITRTQRLVAPFAVHEINAIITTKLQLNRLRGFERPDACRFERDGFDVELVDSMLREVEARFDLAHSFYNLKAQLLQVEGFTYPRRSRAYGSLPDGYSLEQASQILRQVLAGFDLTFAEEFDCALREGRIDALPREGKAGGASCRRFLIEHPSYVLMHFTGELGSVVTLAHEFGHCLNNKLMQSEGLCDALTFGVPTSMAEVAGIFFEKPVLDTIMKQVDDEQRLAILIAGLGDEVANIFRQTAAMRFEQELYARIDTEGYLSQTDIGEMFQRHMGAYLGPCVSMEDADVWWVYWHHFRKEFYNYNYTFAQLIAKALQERLAADPSYITEMRRFLCTGKSQSVKDLLGSMGLNLSGGSIWRAGLDRFATTLDEARSLAHELGKI